MESELGRKVDFEEVKAILLTEFEAVFESTIQSETVVMA
jgi:hypothetical protein